MVKGRRQSMYSIGLIVMNILIWLAEQNSIHVILSISQSALPTDFVRSNFPSYRCGNLPTSFCSGFTSLDLLVVLLSQ